MNTNKTTPVARTAVTRIFLLLLLALLTAPLGAWALGSGATAPPFTLSTPDGSKVSLADFKGRVVVLKIGTTWCPGCRDQSQELLKADDFLQQQGVVLIDVFVDDPAKTVKEYQKEHPMKTPVTVLLGNDRFIRDYGVYLIPRLLIVGPDQKIVTDSGGLTANELKARLMQMSGKQ